MISSISAIFRSVHHTELFSWWIYPLDTVRFQMSQHMVQGMDTNWRLQVFRKAAPVPYITYFSHAKSMQFSFVFADCHWKDIANNIYFQDWHWPKGFI